jgi:hypothetical protein
VASLTQEQFAAVDQRRSTQDLNDILLILRRDGEVSLEGGAPEEVYADDDEQELAETTRDEDIQNSLVMSTTPVGPPPVTDAEAENTKAQAEAEAEWNENQALVPPVPIEDVGRSSAGPAPKAGDDPKSNEDDGAEEKQLPRTHSDLDAIAAERGHEWSDPDLKVEEKQEELKAAKQGS